VVTTFVAAVLFVVFFTVVMPSYKLYYFNGRGAAEPIRIIFAQAGVQYEDIRFQGDDWGKKFKAGKVKLRA